MTEPAPLSRRLDAAAEVLSARLGPAPEVAVILGSGLGGLAEAVEGAATADYAEVPGMPVSTAPSHAGRFVAGRLFGRRAVLMQGRVHLYEGRSAAEVAFPVQLMARLGAKVLVVTNAAGALNPDLAPGRPMLIADHLNFTGVNPLTGPNDDALGPRFPDMSRAWCPDLRALTREAAKGLEDALGGMLAEGIYAGIAGPSLETSAERRWLRSTGADAVGMSTVIEAIAANHAGQRVLGLSAITNAADGGPDQQPDSIEAVLAVAATAGARITRLLEAVLPRMP